MSLPTLVVLLTRLGRLNEAVVQVVCRRHGTTMAEMQVLGVLHHGAADRQMSPTLLAESIVQTSAGLTATLRRLESSHAIRRLPDPNDGRGRLVELTDVGEALHEAIFDDLLEQFGRMLDGTDIDALLASVRTLLEALERSSGRSSSAVLEVADRPSPARRGRKPRTTTLPSS